MPYHRVSLAWPITTPYCLVAWVPVWAWTLAQLCCNIKAAISSSQVRPVASLCPLVAHLSNVTEKYCEIFSVICSFVPCRNVGSVRLCIPGLAICRLRCSALAVLLPILDCMPCSMYKIGNWKYHILLSLLILAARVHRVEVTYYH